MTPNSMGYMLRETMNSLKRNPWLSSASVLTVMVTMIILGFSAFFLANAASIATTFESQIEIAAFVNQDITPEALAVLQKDIEKLPNIASVELTTKEKALAELGEDPNELLDNLGGINPLPDKFTVKVTDPQQVSEAAKQIGALSGVEKVRYGQDFVEKLLSFVTWLRWVGIGVILAFAVASTVLISINIKMNVFSRRKEIQIMKLVGASNSFVRWPFLIEGMLLGLIGGCLAAGIVWLGYGWLASYIQSALTFIPLVNNSQLFIQVSFGILLIGMLIGVVGSAFSLRKFLKV